MVIGFGVAGCPLTPSPSPPADTQAPLAYRPGERGARIQRGNPRFHGTSTASGAGNLGPHHSTGFCAHPCWGFCDCGSWTIHKTDCGSYSGFCDPQTRLRIACDPQCHSTSRPSARFTSGGNPARRERKLVGTIRPLLLNPALRQSNGTRLPESPISLGIATNSLLFLRRFASSLCRYASLCSPPSAGDPGYQTPARR